MSTSCPPTLISNNNNIIYENFEETKTQVITECEYTIDKNKPHILSLFPIALNGYPWLAGTTT